MIIVHRNRGGCQKRSPRNTSFSENSFFDFRNINLIMPVPNSLQCIEILPATSPSSKYRSTYDKWASPQAPSVSASPPVGSPIPASTLCSVERMPTHQSPRASPGSRTCGGSLVAARRGHAPCVGGKESQFAHIRIRLWRCHAWDCGVRLARSRDAHERAQGPGTGLVFGGDQPPASSTKAVVSGREGPEFAAPDPTAAATTDPDATSSTAGIRARSRNHFHACISGPTHHGAPHFSGRYTEWG